MDRMIIDAHCLAGQDYWLSKNKPELAHENYLTEYEQELKEQSTDYRSYIMPFPSSKDGSFSEENELILSLRKERNWVVPVLAYNYNSVDNIRNVALAMDKGLCKDIVIWPIVCGMDLDKLACDPDFRFLLKTYSCRVTVHVGAGNEADIKRVNCLKHYLPEDAIRLAESFPQNIFNLSHLLRLSDKALRHAEQMDNIVIDISGISTHKRWYEMNKNVFPAYDAGELGEMDAPEILRELMGRSRLRSKIVFGTQYPFGKWYNYGVSDEVKIVLDAGLSGEDADRLFYRNLKTIFEGRTND